MPTLFLIDGSSQMYRAYHASRQSKTDGHSTSAVYGFTTMLKKLLADHSQVHRGVVRPSRPDVCDDLARTIKRTGRMLNRSPGFAGARDVGLGVPILPSQLPGRRRHRHPRCQGPGGWLRRGDVTGDKVSSTGRRWRASSTRATRARGSTPRASWTSSASARPLVVLARWATASTTSGVPGIGEKGGARADLDPGTWTPSWPRPPDREQTLPRRLMPTRTRRENRELARIRVDVPVTFEPDTLRYRGPSRERCCLFSSLRFRTLVAECAPTAATSAATTRATSPEIDALAAAASGRRHQRDSHEFIGIAADLTNFVLATREPAATSDRPHRLDDTPNLPAPACSSVCLWPIPPLQVAHDLSCAMPVRARSRGRRDLTWSRLPARCHRPVMTSGARAGTGNYKRFREDLTGRGAKAASWARCRASLCPRGRTRGPAAVLAPKLSKTCSAGTERVYATSNCRLCPCCPRSGAPG